MVNQQTSGPGMISVNAGKTVLVTGAGGSIGSSLASAVLATDPRLLILLDHSERNLHEVEMELAGAHRRSAYVSVLGDICDCVLLADTFEKYHPDIIYHAAACKHVPLMERNPVAAVQNNAVGTSLLARTACKYEASRLIMISTDKAVNPRSVMGASKRVAELALLRWSNSRTQMKAVRLGNVLGSHGSVVPFFLQQISRGGPVTVTHPDVRRFFLTLSEAVELILLAGSLEGDGSIFIPELGEPVKILNLARQLIETAGFIPDKEIPIVFTGLRPGDKMAEELHLAYETVEPTADPRLYRINTPEVSLDRFDVEIGELAKNTGRRELVMLLETICRIVPEYQPSETLLGLLSCSTV
jgi:FlaA1/EpsC-like NDP-sugar epimerase